ncbi:3-oxo-tetronate kinase [Bythopirellula polymerisocia]|nr:3-oxo-tetronate kinase [Bythopirellula polymerisocia]
MVLSIGSIADDYTGAADLASMFVQAGLRTVQWFGPLPKDQSFNTYDAAVIALKTRSAPAHVAVEQSNEALNSLQHLGAKKIFFKYCSTFDSTEDGNIGPVAASLLDRLQARQTIICPAFPGNGRTVYLGHLFVNGCLLNESGMQNHPLNPMTDANLLRILQRQTSKKVGLINYEVVQQGWDAILQRLAVLQKENVQLVICDTLCDDHLAALARAVRNSHLATGGSAIGYWLARDIAEQNGTSLPWKRKSDPTGGAVVLSGSCSPATQRQVACFRQSRPSMALDVPGIIRGDACVEKCIDWAANYLGESPVLIYSSPTPSELAAIHRQFGRRLAAQAVESALAKIAQGLVAGGVTTLVVAGGETSGAVIDALQIPGLSVGPSIETGVPLTESLGTPPLTLVLKSGNFGGDNFFAKALEAAK